MIETKPQSFTRLITKSLPPTLATASYVARLVLSAKQHAMLQLQHHHIQQTFTTGTRSSHNTATRHATNYQSIKHTSVQFSAMFKIQHATQYTIINSKHRQQFHGTREKRLPIGTAENLNASVNRQYNKKHCHVTVVCYSKVVVVDILEVLRYEPRLPRLPW